LKQLGELIDGHEDEAALSLLNDLLHSHAVADPTGLMKEAIRRCQINIRVRQGKMLEALQMCADLRDTCSRDFLMNQCTIVDALAANGQVKEAIRELERALDSVAAADSPESSFGDALLLFTRYAEIAETTGCVIPARFAPLFEQIVDHWGFPPPVAETIRSQPLLTAIKIAERKDREANSRYTNLRLGERGEQRAEERLDSWKAYIESEPVAMYRRLAEQARPKAP
jgi:hypothetical protein